MRLLVLLLAVLPASASVTYTLQTQIGGFSVTMPDFIPNLPVWDTSSSYRSIYFALNELDSCRFPNTSSVFCNGAHIDYNAANGTALLAQIITDNTDHQNLMGQYATAQTDLLHTGTFGRVSITQDDDPVTAAPEPSTFALAFAGLSALFCRWRARR